MKKLHFSALVKSVAVICFSASLIQVAHAEQSATTTIENKVETIGATLDNSMQQLGAYMDESSITAKVKTALLDHDEIKSRDITVETHEGVVTLSGFVASQQQAAEAVALTEKIVGVKSVTDKLHVNDSAQTSIQDYVDDAAITSQIKGKLLREEMTGMRRVRVETSNGIVLLSGRVPSPSMSAKAAALAKTVDGVKSVKNDLTIEP